MHLTFPKKVEDTLRYLKIRILPRTLFFRTMLLIFIPLIVVQVVSIVAFFDGTWGRVGKRLSTNLTSNMAFAMQLAEESPDNIPEIQALTKKIFDIDFQYYPNQEKHDVIHKVRNSNKLVTGFLEDALSAEFPDANTSIYMGKSNPDLAQDLRDMMFVFENILDMDDRSVQRFVRDCDTKDVVFAMKNASEEMKAVFFNNMSKRMADSVRADLEITSNVRLKDVEEAQQRIVNIIRRLEEQGEVIIKKGGDDDDIIL